MIAVCSVRVFREVTAKAERDVALAVDESRPRIKAVKDVRVHCLLCFACVALLARPSQPCCAITSNLGFVWVSILCFRISRALRTDDSYAGLRERPAASGGKPHVTVQSIATLLHVFQLYCSYNQEWQRWRSMRGQRTMLHCCGSWRRCVRKCKTRTRRCDRSPCETTCLGSC